MLYIIAEILEAPRNVTVGLGQGPLSLTCHVRGDTIFIRVDNEVIDHRNFSDRGIVVGNTNYNGEIATQRLTVELTVCNNNTAIVCIGTSAGGPNAVSDPGFIFIAGTELYLEHRLQ